MKTTLSIEVNLDGSLVKEYGNLFITAFRAGFEDGLASPHDLSSGMTYPVPQLNEIYDEGVNFGQTMAKLFSPSASV